MFRTERKNRLNRRVVKFMGKRSCLSMWFVILLIRSYSITYNLPSFSMPFVFSLSLTTTQTLTLSSRQTSWFIQSVVVCFCYFKHSINRYVYSLSIRRHCPRLTRHFVPSSSLLVSPLPQSIPVEDLRSLPKTKKV